MLFSSNLLRRYINIKDNPENIANYLTLKTCEIEEIIKREIPNEVVIGFVTKCEKHPQADKLFVTEVNCGEKGSFQIVTGAENIKKDIYVPVALSGAYLKEKDLKIKPVVMRGLESNGMICSKEELGIKEDLDLHGIWILDKDINTLSKDDLGKKLKDEIPFLENFIFDIDNKTLTNRPDLTGHLCQSIEINAIYKYFEKGKIYMSDVANIFETFQYTNIFETLENSKKGNVQIEVKTELVKSYIALELNNIEIGKTCFEDRLSLIDLGEKTINNFVDFSNMFMLLTGQPIHFFDANKIEGKIIIDTAKGGEEFIDLMDEKYILNEGDIIIKDEEKILALAGIIGGKTSSITEKTKNIVVEIGNFDPTQVRKTGNSLNLRTNAKIRFEKNINPLFTLYSLLLFLDQIKISHLKAEIGGIDYFYKEEVKKILNKYLSLDIEKLIKFSGIKDISEDQIKFILTNLGFSLRNNEVKPAYWRSTADINIQEDVFEEIIRIYGYENIKGEKLDNKMIYNEFNPQTFLTRLVERIFVEQNNFTLLETYPWFDTNIAEKLEKLNKEELYSLQNTTAPENKYLRSNLHLNLINIVRKNFRNYDDIKILETGKVFDTKNGERLFACGCLYKKQIKNWKENNIFELKKVLKEILKEYNLKGLLEFDKQNCEIEKIAHPKQFANILLNKQKIGEIFTLHPYYHKDFKISENSQISFLEIDLTKIIELKEKNKTKAISNLNYYTQEDQIVERDLSFVIDKKSDYSIICKPIEKIKEIINYSVFDVYNLEDKKSISLKVKIFGKNMKNDDINAIMDKAIEAVRKNGGELR